VHATGTARPAIGRCVYDYAGRDVAV
jgi:hypothetical protein